MPRIPKLCHHRGRGLAYATDPASKKQIYFGAWKDPASKKKYKAWLAQFSLHGSRVVNPNNCLIADLVLLFLEWAEGYYRDAGGKITTEFAVVKAALRGLKPVLALRADEFTPSVFKMVRQKLVEQPVKNLVSGQAIRAQSLHTVNGKMIRIKRLMKKAVEWELVPVTVYQALALVPGLTRRTAGALRVAEPIRPVPPEDVMACFPELRPIYRVALQVMLLTGMRVKELVSMRWDDITADKGGSLHLYQPRQHKTAHHGVVKEIHIGPKAWALLRSLDSAAEKEIVFWSRGQGSNLAYRGPLTPDGLRRAIEGAQKRTNAKRLKNNLSPVSKWNLGQIRHTVGTATRAAFGLEAAQAMLGHSSIETTQIYAERVSELAKKIAREKG